MVLEQNCKQYIHNRNLLKVEQIRFFNQHLKFIDYNYTWKENNFFIKEALVTILKNQCTKKCIQDSIKIIKCGTAHVTDENIGTCSKTLVVDLNLEIANFLQNIITTNKNFRHIFIARQTYETNLYFDLQQKIFEYNQGRNPSQMQANIDGQYYFLADQDIRKFFEKWLLEHLQLKVF